MYDSTYADMTTFASAATFASLISTYSMIFVAFYVLIIVAQWKIFVISSTSCWMDYISSLIYSFYGKTRQGI